jgi:hypothetical protein
MASDGIQVIGKEFYFGDGTYWRITPLNTELTQSEKLTNQVSFISII